MSNKFRHWILLILLTMPEFIYTQTDYEFWFAAPEITYEITAPPALARDSLDRPVVLAFTTYDGPAHIVISQPANPAFIPINCTVLTEQFFQIDLTAYIDQIECKPINTVLDKGLLITSDKPINAIYEIQTYVNSETFSLKGRNALGKEFIIPSQNICFNYPYSNPPARNSFTVLATQDQTQVKIVPKKMLEGFSTLDTITILLSRGQTWTGQAVSGDTSAHLGGSFVLSNKPISVTIVDDAIRPYNAVPGLSIDLAGDQLIPKETCGTEYIATFYTFPSHYNYPIIYAFENSTSIFRDGTPLCTLNKGEFYSYQSISNDHHDYITSNKPILIYLFSQYNFWSSNASGQVFPPITCGGSKKVTISYTGPFTSQSNIEFWIITKPENHLNFSCSNPVINAILQDPSSWAFVPGTANQYMAAGFGGGIPPWSAVTFSNSTGTFQLTRVIELQQTARNCVLSEFASLNLGTNKTLCNGDTILLDAGFGRDSYLWSTGATTQTINVTTPGSYWVTVTQGTCTLSDTIVVSASNPAHTGLLPTATACPGDSVLLDAGPGRSWYQWSTGATTQSIYASQAGTYWVTVPVFDCSNTFTDTVSVYIPDSVNLGPDQSICTSDSVLFDAGPGRNTYLWNTGATTQTIWAKTSGSYSVRATYKFCVLQDTVVLTTSTRPVVSVGIDDTLCNGGSKLLDAGYFPGATYLWKELNTSTTVGNSQTYLASAPGKYCVVVNPGSDCSGTDTIQLVFSTPPVLTVVPLNKGICSGEPTNIILTSAPGATFNWTATLSSGSITGFSADSGKVINQILVNHGATAGNVTYTITPKLGRCIGTPADYVVTVNPGDSVSVSIVASDNNICSGTSVTFTATPTGTGTLTYNWKVNGASQGVNNPVFNFTPANGDVVTCVLSSTITTCVTNNLAASNSITMVVNPPLTPVITVSPSQNNACQGTSVTFTATVAPTGGTNHYQWKVNNVPVGTDQPTYAYTPVNGDITNCDLNIINLNCLSSNSATSTPITMVVTPNLTASVSISTPVNPVCSGIPVTITAIPSNGGATPSYQWKVNNGNVGISQNNYTYLPINGDVVTCAMTTSIASCATPTTATANPITMVISPLPVVTYTHCTDTITTLNARPIKLKGGIPLGGTYSGPGVNSVTGVFSPAIAGTGTKTITYSYTNAGSCNSSKSRIIKVVATPVFTCGNTFRDIRDNRDYSTFFIGSQCWMAEDLAYGTAIPQTSHQRDNCVVEKYESTVGSPQSAVYQWDEVMEYSSMAGEKGLCPAGWHVPTEAEWQTLFGNYTNSAFAAAALKYSGFSGFNGLLTGTVPQNENWQYQSFGIFYWTSTSYGPYKAWAHGFNEPDPSASTYPSGRLNAFSVRCIKD